MSIRLSVKLNNNNVSIDNNKGEIANFEAI